MKIISLIGRSGSGKTDFISKAIKLLNISMNYKIGVIKNIHEHKVDEKGKDTYKFSEAGANYSVMRNLNNEIAIFLKIEASIEKIIEWLSIGPYKCDLFFLEGFRNLNYPTILCLKDWDELTSQLNNNVKIISGLISLQKSQENFDLKIPIIDIQRDFDKFLAIFNIK